MPDYALAILHHAPNLLVAGWVSFFASSASLAAFFASLFALPMAFRSASLASFSSLALARLLLHSTQAAPSSHIASRHQTAHHCPAFWQLGVLFSGYHGVAAIEFYRHLGKRFGATVIA